MEVVKQTVMESDLDGKIEDLTQTITEVLFKHNIIETEAIRDVRDLTINIVELYIDCTIETIQKNYNLSPKNEEAA